MGDVKVFEFAVKRAGGDVEEDPDEVYEFQPFEDGPMLKAYFPTPPQLAMLMAATGRGSSRAERDAGTINFFLKVLDDDSAAYIEARLLDRKDPFGEEDEIQQLTEWLVEQWSGNPTNESPDSTSQRQSTGPTSKPRTRALI